MPIKQMKSKTSSKKTSRLGRKAFGAGVCRCGLKAPGTSSRARKSPGMAWDGFIGLEAGTSEAAKRGGYALAEGLHNDGMMGLVMAEPGEI